MNYIISAAIAVFSLHATAQNNDVAVTMIPASSEFVMTMNPAAVNNWLGEGLSQDPEDDLFKDFTHNENLFQWALSDTQTFDHNQKYYAFQAFNDSTEVMCLVAPIKNSGGITTMVDEILGEDAEHEQKRSYELYRGEEHLMAFSSTHAVFMELTVPWSWYYQEMEMGGNYYMEEGEKYEAMEDRRDQMRKDLMDGVVERVMTGSWEKSLTSVSAFNRARDADNDIVIFRNEFMSNMENVTGVNQILGRRSYYGGSYNQPVEDISERFKGNHQYSFLDLNEEGLKMKTDIQFNDVFAEDMKKLIDSDFESDLLRYIDGRDLMGIYSFQFNPEGFVDMVADIFEPLLEKGEGRTAILGDFMQIAAALIDREKVEDALGGHVMFAVTGTREVDVLYTRYDYDQETYTRSRIIESKKESRPEYVMAMHSENEKVLRQVLDLFVSQGRLLPKGDYYVMRNLRQSAQTDIYMAFVNETFLVSNNSDLMEKYLVTGFPSSYEVPKNVVKQLKKNNVYAWFDLGKYMDVATEEDSKGGMTGLFENQLNMGLGDIDEDWMEVRMKGFERDGNHFISQGEIKIAPSFRILFNRLFGPEEKATDESYMPGYR